MDNKYSREFHNFGDKDFDCPHHTIDGKYFILVSNNEATYCSAQDIGFEKKLAPRIAEKMGEALKNVPKHGPVRRHNPKEWGNPDNLRFLVSKIENDWEL